MSDYIKREDAIKAIARYLSPVFERAEEGATRVLSDIPCADVVEVVRCKYCKYSRVADMDDQEDGYLCSLLRGHEFFSYDYCSYGERKTKDE